MILFWLYVLLLFLSYGQKCLNHMTLLFLIESCRSIRNKYEIFFQICQYVYLWSSTLFYGFVEFFFSFDDFSDNLQLTKRRLFLIMLSVCLVVVCRWRNCFFDWTTDIKMYVCKIVYKKSTYLRIVFISIENPIS